MHGHALDRRLRCAPSIHPSRPPAQLRAAQAGKKIWEKTDYTSTLGRTRKAMEELAPDVDPAALRKAKESKGLITAATVRVSLGASRGEGGREWHLWTWTLARTTRAPRCCQAAIARDRRHEKESMADFVAKKREMFLLQMSLDIKREEIAKLEQKASQKEEALKKSELMLEEDAIRFDAFLKENDQRASAEGGRAGGRAETWGGGHGDGGPRRAPSLARVLTLATTPSHPIPPTRTEAHDALKKAEAQAKAKAEKMHELKKLKHAIGLVAAEKGKLKEVLDDYKRYQEFLDALTPREWTEDQHRQRRERIEAERVRRFEVKLGDWDAQRLVREAEVMAQVEAQRRQALKVGKVLPKVDVAAVVAQVRERGGGGGVGLLV